MSDGALSERQIVERVYGWREAVLGKAARQALYLGIPPVELEDVFQESALYLCGRRDIVDDDGLRGALWQAFRFRVGHYYRHKAVERAAEPQLAAQAYVVDQGDDDPVALAEHALQMAHVEDFLAELCGRE